MNKPAGAALFIIITFSLLVACGEMDMLLFPTNRNYQIQALVNGNSLEDRSLVRSDDKIHPFFALSVANDPDLTGLLVFLTDSQGEIVGDRVFYVLETYSGDYPEAETQDEDETVPLSDAGDWTTWGLQDPLTSRESWGFINTNQEALQFDLMITVRSLDQEIPHFPLPHSLDIGQYSLVFEAIGNNETLHRTETNFFYLSNLEFSLRDIGIHLPGAYETQPITPGTIVLLEPNLTFDSRFEPYITWYNGRSIISEGYIHEGAGSILWQAPERSGFYALRVEVLPFQLGKNISGIFRDITLPVSTKTGSANRSFFFEETEHTALNLLSTGTLYSPEMPAPDEETENEEEHDVLQPVLLTWHQFGGYFHDTMAPEQSLEPAAEKNPLWAAAGNSYGLATGPEDAYLLSPITFLHDSHDEGGGLLLFHTHSLADGTIFSAFFPFMGSSTHGAHIDVIRREMTIVLVLRAEGMELEIPVFLVPFESRVFLPAAVEFYIRPYRLEAKLSLENHHSLHSAAGSIRLPGPLAGTGKITLGGGPPITVSYDSIPSIEPNDIEIYDGEVTELIIIETEPPGLVYAPNSIWNEFAVLYSSLPILEEEIFENELSTAGEPADDDTPVGTDETPAHQPEPDLLPEGITNHPLTDVEDTDILIVLDTDVEFEEAAVQGETPQMDMIPDETVPGQ